MTIVENKQVVRAFYFDETSSKRSLYLSAPDSPNRIDVATQHHLRSLSFATAQWQRVIDEASEGSVTMDHLLLFRGSFSSPAIRSVFRNLWALCDEEGTASRLLASGRLEKPLALTAMG